MFIISIAIQKGGTGKTTTAINLAAALMILNKRVLLVDADPQANLTQSVGITEEPERNLFTELRKKMDAQDASLNEARMYTKTGLHIIPASIKLSEAEPDMESDYEGEKLFAQLLQPMESEYDFILIDCPPSQNIISKNALMASQYVLMPLQAEYLPLNGVYSFIKHLNKITESKKKAGLTIEILGFVFTKYDEHKNMNRNINKQLKNEFGNKVFDTCIRNNIQLANAQQSGADIFSFDERANGAKDYMALAKEFLSRLNSSSGKEKDL